MSQPGRNILICFVLAATASMPVAADLSGRNGLSAAFGGEYQYISQEYYNAVLDTTTVDVIEVWQLNADKIDDFIFKTNLGYDFQNRVRKISIMGDLELSDDRILGRAEGFLQLGGYENRLKLFGKFESKSPSADNDNRVEEYDYFQVYLGGKKRLGAPVNVTFRTGFEKVSFGPRPSPAVDTSDSVFDYSAFYSYDYYMLSGRLGGDFILSEFVSELSWRFGYNHREVPDSGEADYDQYRFGLEYNYSGLPGIFSLEGEIEFRDYMQPEKADDFGALVFRGRASRSLGNKVELGGNLQSDWYWYRRPDVVNRDYLLVRGEINETTRLNGFGWGPLIRLEYRQENSLPNNEIELFSEGYGQWEAGIHADFFNRLALFLNGEITYGSRNYREEGGFLTSYRFWSVGLIANYSLFRNVSLNLIFDGHFEGHEIREDDTNLYLLSLGVTARI